MQPYNSEKWQNSAIRRLSANQRRSSALPPVLGASAALGRSFAALPLAPESSSGAFVCTSLPSDKLLAGRFRLLELLGEGARVHVYRAEDVLRRGPPVAGASAPAGLMVAVKVYHAGEKVARVALQEEERLRSLCDADSLGALPVLRLLARGWHGPHLCLAMQLGEPLSALRPLSSPSASARGIRLASVAELQRVAHDLLCALAFLHSRGLMHADIKLENVLMRRDSDRDDGGMWRARLSDLGNSIRVQDAFAYEDDYEVVSLGHRAPELLVGAGPIGPAIDCFALGALLFELYSQQPLVAPPDDAAGSPGGDQRGDVLRQLTTLLGPLPSSLSRGKFAALWPNAFHGPPGRLTLLIEPIVLQTLLLALLDCDPTRRVSARDALLHPFFAVLCPLMQLLSATPLPALSPFAHTQLPALRQPPAVMVAALSYPTPAPVLVPQQSSPEPKRLMPSTAHLPTHVAALRMQQHMLTATLQSQTQPLPSPLPVPPAAVAVVQESTNESNGTNGQTKRRR